MRLGCLLRRERRRDAQCDEPILDLLTQPIQQISTVVIAADRCLVKGNSALVAAPATHGHEAAAVPYRANGEFALKRTVGKAVDAIGRDPADLRGDVIASRNDDIGAQRTNELFISGRGISDDMKPVRLRELYYVTAVAPCRARDSQSLASPQRKLIQRLAGSQSIHRQCGG